MTIMDLSIQWMLLYACLLCSSFQLICGDTAPPFNVMEFTSTPSDTVVIDGEAVMLPCSATYNGRKPSAYSWKRNGRLIGIWNQRTSAENNRFILTNGSLLFSSVSGSGWPTDTGRYHCIAEEQQLDRVHRIIAPGVELSLASQPIFKSQPKDLQLLAGETAMFRCEVQSEPQATYSWTHNRVRVRESSNIILHSGGEVLEVKAIDHSHNGSYRCTARNVAGRQQSLSASLTVIGHSAEDETTLATKDSLSLESDGVGEHNSTSILSKFFDYFGFGGGDSSQDKTTASPVLLASTLTAFPFHLIANFSLNRPSSLTAVLAPSPTPQPRLPAAGSTLWNHLGTNFVMKPWATSVTLGSPVTLFCAVNGTDSNRNLPTVTWLKSGSTIDTSAGARISITGSASLRILNTSLEDDGLYTCRGENLEDSNDATARLSVKVPPYFITKPRNTYGRANEDIMLYCQVGGIPVPRVVWWKDSEIVEDSQYFRYVGHNLKIMGLMPTDAAYYQCMASNELGTVFAVSQLIVIDTGTQAPGGLSSPMPTATDSSARPPAAVNLRATMVTHSYVTLQWSTGDDSSAGITYSVSFKQSTASRLRVANTTKQDYVAEGLQPNTEYIFSVRSVNTNGYSDDTAEITVTTLAALAVPQAVENMSALAKSEDSIAVKWQPPTVTNGAITAYRVYFGDLFMQTNSTSITLPDLHPYTQYYVKVVAFNKNGQGIHSPEQLVRTFSSKPSAPPTNVTLEVSGASTIALRWRPPPQGYLNGVVTGYKIRFKRKDRDNRAKVHTADGDANSYELTELEADVTYQVRIAAVNVNGSGDFSPWLEATTYTVELDERQAPGRPSYIQLKAFPREMIVSWGSTEDSDQVVVKGFMISYGIGVPEQLWVEDIPRSTRMYTLTGLIPQNQYVVQVMAFNDAGTGASAEQVATTAVSVHPNSELGAPVEVNATVISPHSVILTWYDKDLSRNQEPMEGRIYTVKYNALTSFAQRKTVFKNSTSLVLSIDDLKPYTTYEFSVMVSQGSRASIYSMSIRNTTFESVPSSPPRDLTITLIENKANMLMVSWQPPGIPNGRIITYTIYSSTDYDKPMDSWIVEDVEGDQLNHEFGPVTTSTLYYFRIAAHNSKGASPPSATSALQTPSSFQVFGLDSRPVKNSPPADHSPPQNFAGSSNDAVSSSPANGVPSAQTLWIVIAIVSAVTVMAIAALVIVMCRRKIISDRRKPANLKASNQAPKGMNKNNKQNAPNLWIDHQQVEMKALNKEIEPTDAVDESTSMLHSDGSNFDSPSVLMEGYSHIDEPRYCTLGRQRPAVVPPYQQREAMPRATVQPMISDNGRPLYPRTQFVAHHPGNIPRVNLGDSSQPVTETSSFCTDPLTGLTGVSPLVNGAFTNGDLEPYNHVSAAPYHNKPYMINGEEIPPPRPPPMESRLQPLRFRNNSNTGHTIPKHIVKPQPVTFKPSPNEESDTDSLKRPPRPPYINRQLSQASLGKGTLKMSLKNGSTEQLNTDMANLDNLMQDLTCIS